MTPQTKVAVGLSGGVDSSVATKLLLDQGHEVIGIFLKNWDSSDPQCPTAVDAADARSVADNLGIPFHSFDFSREYWDNVFEYFLQQNRAGRTPNPDILCNKYIKFDQMLKYARELGCKYLATGHYARRVWNEETSLYELHVPEDKDKDQTYFLYTLGQEQLKHVLFPLEGIQKAQVRQIARDAGLKTAEKKDSTGICFVGERNYSEFLKKYVDTTPGEIVTAEDGTVLGTHDGLPFYTIGQRRELGIGGVRGAEESPWFVICKDFAKNALVVSQNEDLLLGTELVARDLHWVAGEPPAEKFECKARIRYRSEAVPCLCHSDPDSSGEESSALKVEFSQPVRAIAPGQSVVFYSGSVCLGGGEIE